MFERIEKIQNTYNRLHEKGYLSRAEFGRLNRCRKILIQYGWL